MKEREVARTIHCFNKSMLEICDRKLCVKHEHSNKHSPCLQELETNGREIRK